MAGTSNSITTHNVLNGVLNADNVISGLVNTAFNPAYALVTQAGAQIVLFINSSDYKMYAQLKDKSGNLIYTSNIIDLPLETMVVDGRYDSGTKKLILVLDNGNEIEVPLGALISGLVNENDLVANYYDKDEIDVLLDGYWTKIELTQEDIDNWNAKQEYLNQGDGIEISADTILKGNTSQATTTGKNLLPNNATTQTMNGITFTINKDGSVTINGTSTAQAYINLFISTTQTLISDTTKTYIYSKGVSNADIILGIYEYINSNWVAKKYVTNDTTTYTPSEEQTGQLFRIVIDSGKTLNNVTVYPQLEQGSTATSYEPYTNGASPNPDYPQDIHVVSGDNSINVVGKNLFTLKNISNATALGVERTINNSELKLNGTSSGAGRVIGRQTTGIILPGGTYSVLVQKKSGNVTPNGKYTVFYFRKPDGTEITALNINNYSGNYSFKTTFVLSEETELYVEIYCTEAGYTLDNLELQFQIEKGSTATTYEPYQGNTYPVNLPVENLFDKDNANVLNGMFINGSSRKIDSNANATTVYIPINPNTTYCVSKTKGNRFAIGYSSTTPAVNVSLTNVVDDKTKTSLTSTSSSDSKYLVIYISLSDTETYENIISTIQVEYGSKANSYTPYGTTPIELCKIGNYQDYFYKDGDKWYLHKVIGKVVFTGGNDETWNISETSTSGSNRFLNESIVNLVTKPSDSSVTINTLSNNFVAKSANQTYLNQEGIDISKIGNLHIYSDTTKNYTVAQFKTWLSTHNTIVYYPLATPTTTEITDSTLISQLNALIIGFSNNWVENVSQTNADLLFEIEYDNKNLTISASSNLVRNTDYATSNTGGVVKVQDTLGLGIGSTGNLFATTKTYATYQTLSEGAIVGKGTLDNVLNAKIGNIQTLLDNLNNGNGVE